MNVSFCLDFRAGFDCGDTKTFWIFDGFFILDFRASYDRDGTSAVFSFRDFRAVLPFTDFSTHWFWT